MSKDDSRAKHEKKEKTKEQRCQAWEIVLRAKAGDENAEESLLRDVTSRVSMVLCSFRPKLLIRLLMHREDIVFEIFEKLRVHLSDAKIRDLRHECLQNEKHGYAAYVNRMISNTAKDILRSWGENVSLGAFMEGVDLNTGNPEKDYLMKRTAGIISDVLEKSPERARKALTLVILEGMKYKHAAQVLGVPESTVKSDVRRIKLEIRRRLLE